MYTSANGTIDYAGGSAARTGLKDLLRSRATPYPIINKYNPVTKPNPRFWYANPRVTWGMRGLGLLSIAYDVHGLTSGSIGVTDFSLNSATTGAMTFGELLGLVLVSTSLWVEAYIAFMIINLKLCQPKNSLTLLTVK